MMLRVFQLIPLVSLLLSAAPVSGPLVVSDRWPESTDLLTWVRDVMRLAGVERATETAQGKAMFQWLRLFNRMATGGMIQAHEGPHGNERYVLDAHKNLFVYGWGYCDTTSRIAEAVWKEFKGDPSAAERVCVLQPDGGYHTMYRLRLDGQYGAFDPRYGYYLVDRDEPDARILDWAEVGDDRNFHRNRAFRHRSRPFFEYFGREWDRALLLEPVFFASEEKWVAAGKPPLSVFGNSQYRMGTQFHAMDFVLERGMKIERFWDNSARAFYAPAGKQAQREEAFLPSGRFYRVTESMLDGNWVKHDPNYQLLKPYLSDVPAREGYNRDVAGGRTIGQAWGRLSYQGAIPRDRILNIVSPYVLVEGTLQGSFAVDTRIELRVMAPKLKDGQEPDAWSPWQTIHEGTGRYRVALGRARFNGRDVSIHGAYRFQLRFSGPDAGESLVLETLFENSITSLPMIFAGRNTIRFRLRDADKLEAPIAVEYRYQTLAGVRAHRRVLRRESFRNNLAEYRLDAPGLIRCLSVAVMYSRDS